MTDAELLARYDSSIWHRYYQSPPEEKTIEQCRLHGLDHGAYNWNPQFDPRWSDDQKVSYLKGYRQGCCL